jgi:DNA-binding response OmpR family regulator
MSTAAHILIVEDNQNMAYGIVNNLEIEGYRVTLCKNGKDGLATALSEPIDVIVLDLMLPGLDGFSLLRQLRESGDVTPVLILSARDEEIDKVRGFRFGADQYVTKPFSVLELLARIESLLRRNRNEAPQKEKPSTITLGNIEIEPKARTLKKAGKPVALAPKEYDLLMALIAREGAVALRLELIQEVWGYPGDVLTRTVDTHIAELRRKLEDDPAKPRHILTVRKTGYRLQWD